jgi:hypothetical protein
MPTGVLKGSYTLYDVGNQERSFFIWKYVSVAPYYIYAQLFESIKYTQCGIEDEVIE